MLIFLKFLVVWAKTVKLINVMSVNEWQREKLNICEKMYCKIKATLMYQILCILSVRWP